MRVRLLVEGRDTKTLEEWSKKICGAIQKQIGALFKADPLLLAFHFQIKASVISIIIVVIIDAIALKLPNSLVGILFQIVNFSGFFLYPAIDLLYHQIVPPTKHSYGDWLFGSASASLLFWGVFSGFMFRRKDSK